MSDLILVVGGTADSARVEGMPEGNSLIGVGEFKSVEGTNFELVPLIGMSYEPRIICIGKPVNLHRIHQTDRQE